MRVIVIGGGASGMVAALSAAEQGAAVLLLERQARVGRKLAATGNGRCNLTNMDQSPAHYHGASTDFASRVLAAFPLEDTLRFFRGLGLLTVAEPGGRVYPLSDNAGSVVDVLRFALDSGGVRQELGCEVRGIQRLHSGFRVTWDGGAAEAERVVVACGGAAGGKLGGGTEGYRLLESLGHHASALRPALVQLRTAGSATRALKGVRADAGVRVYHGRRLLAETAGELQFTELGLSGPAIFEVSREALSVPEATVSLDLLRAYSYEEVRAMLAARAASRPKLTADDLFTGMIQNRLGRSLVKACGLAGATALSDLQGDILDTLCEAVKQYNFTVTGDLGFENAQVTSGGVDTKEFSPKTLESRLNSGLYACGELLDVDGDCGGYNLQWAWSSGRLAGRSAGCMKTEAP